MWKKVALSVIVVSIAVNLCGCGMWHTGQERGIAASDCGNTPSAASQDVNAGGENLEKPENESTEPGAAGLAQIRLIAGEVKKWTKMDSGAGEPYCSYAVTDLDQNGRLEIIESSADQGSGRYTTSEYFQVNETGDALEKIATPYDEGASEEDIVSNMATAYYDAAGGYHYITGDFASAGAAIGCFDSVAALTLSGGKLTSELLGYMDRYAVKKDKFHTDYYKFTRKGKEKKVSKGEYDEEELADRWFSDCAKLSVEISWFSFEKKIAKYSQEELVDMLEQSYDGFCLGYPVNRVQKKILGYSVQVPEIMQMEDQEKQKRLNQLITQRVKKELKNYCMEEDMPFHLYGYSLTVEYAGRDEISILGEIDGYAEGAPHPWRGAYTMNLDLEQEREISQKEILPKKYRKEVEKLILNKNCRDASEGASMYRKAVKELNGKNTKNLVEANQWKYLDVYYGKSRNTVGVVITTPYGMGSYAIYEVYSNWFEG